MISVSYIYVKGAKEMKNPEIKIDTPFVFVTLTVKNQALNIAQKNKMTQTTSSYDVPVIELWDMLRDYLISLPLSSDLDASLLRRRSEARAADHRRTSIQELHK